MSDQLTQDLSAGNEVNATRGDLYWIDEYPQIDESDDALREYIAKSELPVLLAALAVTLRDSAILEPGLRPPLRPMGPYLELNGGMDEEQLARGREIAFNALKRVQREGIRRVDVLPQEISDEMLDWFTNGRSKDAAYEGQLKHEFNLDPNKNGSADWHFDELAKDREFEMLIVGAGISGIAAAWRLSEAGIPFTWIEGSHRVGGTWWKNHYPGVRLDTPTYGYSFSFAQKTDWPHQFATGNEVLEYLEDVFDKAGWTEDDVEFHTHLVRAEFDEESGLWEAITRTKTGEEQTRHFNGIITGVGQLDHPFIPEWPGQESFSGAQMHSQEWDHSVDLKGKKVAVVGTGASAYQIVPAIAEDVEQLYVFQRSAPWMLPAPTYHDTMSDAAEWLHAKVPHYGHLFRLWVTAGGIDGRIHIAQAEEGWAGAPLSVSAENEKFRQAVIERYKEQYEGRPDLLEVAIPQYPPSAKRMLRDNGVWAAALRQPTTRVITSGLESFEPDGLVTGEGEKLDVDVVIYATGFRPSDYLDPIEIGRGGVEIHEYWGGDAKGFAGITVPGFPNLFMLLGPNTGGVVAGGLHFMIERAAEYTVKAIKEILERDAKGLDLKQEALDEHIAWVDRENYNMTWGQEYVKTWYKNKFNRVSQVWPFRTSEYWNITEAVNMEDYEVL